MVGGAGARTGRLRGESRVIGRSAGAALLGVALVVAAPAGGEETAGIAATLARSPLHPRTRASLARALRLAESRLASARCRQIFSEFEGAWDRPLSPPDASRATLLQGLQFRNGEPYPPCRKDGVLAFTRPGSRVVYLCGEQFNRAAFENLEYAANILIHEGLHCLGLRENPPSSRQITARIAADCGARAYLASGPGIEDERNRLPGESRR